MGLKLWWRLWLLLHHQCTSMSVLTAEKEARRTLLLLLLLEMRVMWLLNELHVMLRIRMCVLQSSDGIDILQQLRRLRMHHVRMRHQWSLVVKAGAGHHARVLLLQGCSHRRCNGRPIAERHVLADAHR